MEIEDEIDQTLIELGAAVYDFKKCEKNIAVEVVHRVESTFVNGKPSVWWFSLKHVVFRKHYANGGFLHFDEFLSEATFEQWQPTLECWFMPEQPHQPHNVVYTARVDQLEKVIGNCFAFAYYIVDKNFNWMLVENDDDQLILCIVQ